MRVSQLPLKISAIALTSAGIKLAALAAPTLSSRYPDTGVNQEAVASYAGGPPIAQMLAKRLLMPCFSQDLRSQIAVELADIRR